MAVPISKSQPMMLPMNPQIILLKEGTDTSQGKAQLLSNITACLSVVEILKSTLGPCGMDKLIVDSKGKTTISNDGATIMKLLDVVHPAARSLVEIARAQDAEVGDGTTSVILLAGELLSEAKVLIEEGMSPRSIIVGFRKAANMALEILAQEGLAIPLKGRQMLEKIAATSMNSKIIKGQQSHFTRLVVDAILLLADLSLSHNTQVANRESISANLADFSILVGMKKVPGGAMQDSTLVEGVAFKKTFSYAGFEQQPKCFENPRILLLNVELELKAERDNAEIRMSSVSDYAAIVDSEWRLLQEKLDRIVATGCNVVLSRLPIGDVATQFFADQGLFCAGRVPAEDLRRLSEGLDVGIAASTTDASLASAIGTCALFEERQVGAERYNFFSGIPNRRIVTFLLRGGSEQFIAEIERSLHDALMVVRRALLYGTICVGGGATEMVLSTRIREASWNITPHENEANIQRVIAAFAKSLEVIPRQLCYNGGLDAVDALAKLRKKHNLPDSIYYGINLSSTEQNDSIGNLFDACVFEPITVKKNMISAAVEAAELILSVDETVKASPPPQPDAGMPRRQ